jgi:putative chitinase
MSIAMPTRSEFMRFAPKADQRYVKSFLDLEPELEKAGILHHPLILSHFLAQCWAETGGFTIVRENMTYRSVERIRQVWPARARKHTDAWIKMNLVGNPVALASWAYNGRMSNRHGTTDGYDFRGGGPIQTTGRHACQKYCKQLGVPFAVDVLDDIKITWQFAIFEWVSSGCNSLALENDILGISKAINVGSATSSVMPNGLNHRKAGLRRAWAIWGDPKRQNIPQVSDVTEKTLRDLGSETVKISDIAKGGAIAGGLASGSVGAASESGKVVTVPVTTTAETVEQANDALRTSNESVNLITEFMINIKAFWLLLSTNLWIVGVVCAVAGYFAVQQIKKRRLLDARMGHNNGRLGQIIDVDDPLEGVDVPDVIPRH